MIISNLFRPRAMVTPTWTRPELVTGAGYKTQAGQTVTPDSSKQVATAYRCANLISDDVAKMPLQQFVKIGNQISRVQPDAARHNMAYTVEMMPNPWMTPFLLKKTAMMWCLFWGNGFLWMPVGRVPQIYPLPTPITTVEKDDNGSLFYRVAWPGEKPQDIPFWEVLNIVINSTDGVTGKSVIAYAKETLGRRMAASGTQSEFYEEGLRPSAVMHFPGDLNKEARKKIKDEYTESMRGSGLAVLDAKVDKFETVQMNPGDAQFLESIQATDVEIANFFGLPLHKLNQGKQAYNSNEQRNLDYLNDTLDTYLVQWEQAAQLRWLSISQQGSSYWRFERNALLRTDAKTRAEYLEKKIFSGQMTPNEARAIEDTSPYDGGDYHYVPANMRRVEGGNDDDDL